jgi:hypothetical protein
MMMAGKVCQKSIYTFQSLATLCGVAKLMNIHKEHLAKFGYRPNMNFFKRKILLNFGYFREPVVKIWIFFKKSEIDKLEPIFPQNSFVPLCGHHISQVGKMPKFSKIKKHCSIPFII